MSPFARSVLLTWLLLTIVLPSYAFKFRLPFYSKTHVSLTNSLGGNLDLTLHCKSKDDDLDFHGKMNATILMCTTKKEIIKDGPTDAVIM
ncbi:hypothetical protein AAHE18_04G175900 [Arachis hypogaea]